MLELVAWTRVDRCAFYVWQEVAHSENRTGAKLPGLKVRPVVFEGGDVVETIRRLSGFHVGVDGSHSGSGSRTECEMI